VEFNEFVEMNLEAVKEVLRQTGDLLPEIWVASHDDDICVIIVPGDRGTIRYVIEGIMRKFDWKFISFKALGWFVVKSKETFDFEDYKYDMKEIGEEGLIFQVLSVDGERVFKILKVNREGNKIQLEDVVSLGELETGGYLDLFQIARDLGL